MALTYYGVDFLDENNNATLSSSSKWDKYLRLIREAKANYVACESTNCSCYNR